MLLLDGMRAVPVAGLAEATKLKPEADEDQTQRPTRINSEATEVTEDPGGLPPIDVGAALRAGEDRRLPRPGSPTAGGFRGL
jgi:hypothetical protein